MEIGRTDPAIVLDALPVQAEDLEVRSRARAILDTLTREFSTDWAKVLSETETPRLLRLLGHQKPDLRIAILQLLGLRGDPSARQPVERMTSDEDADVAEAARVALELMDPVAFESLCVAEEASRRLDFVLAVRTRRDTRQISRLAELVFDPVPPVRIISEETLHALGVNEPGVALREAAARQLENPDAVARRNAVQFIARWKPEGGRARVTPLLADPNPTVRRAAVEALAALNGPTAGDVIAPLLADASPMVQSAASEAIAQLNRTPSDRDPK